MAERLPISAQDRRIRDPRPSPADLAPARRDRRPVATAVVSTLVASLTLGVGVLAYRVATSGGPNDFGTQVGRCVSEEMAAHPRGADPAGNPIADSGLEYVSDCAAKVQAAQSGK